MLEKIFAAATALKAGEALKNPDVWKNRQSLMNIFLSMLGVIPIFIDIDISEAELNSIAFGLVTVASIVNTYITNASSEKVGITSKSSK